MSWIKLGQHEIMRTLQAVRGELDETSPGDVKKVADLTRIKRKLERKWKG